MIPNSLGNNNPNTFLPAFYLETICSLKYYVVENIRNARRFLKSIEKSVIIDELTFFELNKHTKPGEIGRFLEPVFQGYDLGVISEAGLPGIADPGAAVVQIAHKKNIEVVPITGPSSLFLTLMASGLNGQCFRFSGYLPVNSNERIQKLRRLENRALKEHESQLFIETPYRNNAMLADIIKACKPTTLLTIGVDLTTENEMIKTRTIRDWEKKKPELHKRPAVFILGS